MIQNGWLWLVAAGVCFSGGYFIQIESIQAPLPEVLCWLTEKLSQTKSARWLGIYTMCLPKDRQYTSSLMYCSHGILYLDIDIRTHQPRL
ncbi:hypothetical protein L211DRAFT_128909 [Terfezia boudieri ATCC MYA-4762]|uniref:Uncharacterized protein n=1 Tax=Terfezia boudieri ATCC MYA-4762 TaxID=1051890 RepID=A0A3N4LUN6_9PEZI|nr:hypothetical protein L211DRAFT_128909 [Terfezia boudieri ATCC MYA-4762]